MEETQEQKTEDQARAEHNEQVLRAIREADAKVGSELAKWESAKAEASIAKKRYELAVDKLRSVIESADQMQLPFPGDEESPSREAWRDVSVDELDIPDALKAKLREAGLATLGEMATYAITGQLIDIEGVGQASAEKIERALEAYWAAHPQPEAEPEVESDPDDDDEEDDDES